jgi:PilZ domain
MWIILGSYRGEKMEKRRKINGKDVINDLRSGMADWQLQVKYKISTKSLRTIFRRLVKSNAISHSELYESSSLYRERTDHLRARKHPRADLDVYVPIYDIVDSAIGVLRDISESGLRVAGVNASVGQAKTFQIPVDMLIEAPPLLIMAECKWVEIKRKNREYSIAGFQIVDLPEKDCKILKDFIKLLFLSTSGDWQLID